MLLSHLSLTHFRNYHQLNLDFTGRFTLLQGENGEGKTNLLEAIFFLATSKPVHAQTEREVVDWRAQDEPIPYSRVAGRVQNQTSTTDLEILLTARGDGLNYAKQVKINGVNRRSMDLVGLLRAVLFLPEDIKLVDGGPGERRRYLDIALCQIDREYYRALVDFQKVLTRRNRLLKTLGETARPTSTGVDAQLGFWDEKLAQYGSQVIVRRQQFVLALEPIAHQRHAELSGGHETLQLHYLPSFNPGYLNERDFARLTDSQVQGGWPAVPTTPLDSERVAEQYLARLRSRRAREIAAGTTLYGPHRDDLRFVVNGRDMRVFGSRGQQRTGALAIKLAEVHVSTAKTGVTPLLLLDDVMSELDAQRRQTLLLALDGVEQAIITTTDLDDFTAGFRAQAQLLHVHAGAMKMIDPSLPG
jgi:DNA replication and repair protein RecF